MFGRLLDRVLPERLITGDPSLSIAAAGLASGVVQVALGGPEPTVRAENGRVRTELPRLDGPDIIGVVMIIKVMIRSPKGESPCGSRCTRS